MDLQGAASGPDDVWSPFQSGRIWPGGRLSLQSVCFWLPGLFLLQFKQSGRGLKCNCVYKHPKEFHMVCRMWSWLNLKRLNVLRQLQSCLFHKSMQFVGGRPAQDELWETQLVWPVSPVAGTSEARCVTVAFLNIQTSSSLQHTHTHTHTRSPSPFPHLHFVSCFLIWTLSKWKRFPLHIQGQCGRCSAILDQIFQQIVALGVMQKPSIRNLSGGVGLPLALTNHEILDNHFASLSLTSLSVE